MTLQEFLLGHTLDAIETLPDNRLINVVVDNGGLYGVVVDNVPEDVPVTRHESPAYDGTTITVDSLSFDTTDYVMLG